MMEEEFQYPTTEEVNEIERECFEPEEFFVSNEILKLEDLETRANKLLQLDSVGVDYWDYVDSKCRYHGHKSIAYKKLKRKIASLVGLDLKTVHYSLKNDMELKTLYDDRTVEEILAYNVTTKTRLDEVGNVIRADLTYTCYYIGDRRYKITDDYYIHPITQILMKTPQEVKQPKKEKPIESVKLSDYLYLKKSKGIWYMIQYIDNPSYDPVKGRRYGFDWYSNPLKQINRKQLNHKQLKQYKVRND